MTAYNTKGTKIKIVPKSASPITAIPSAVTLANPAVVTVGDVTGMADGDFAKVKSIGFEEINNSIYYLGDVQSGANTFALVGSDTTDSNGALVASPEIDVYSATDGLIVCLSSIDIGAPSVNQVDVSTFCKEQSLPGRTTPGTVTLNGYTDKSDSGLAELIMAANDAEPRLFYIELSNDQGFLVSELTFAGFSFTVPLEGGYGYTLSGTQSTPFTWVHD